MAKKIEYSMNENGCHICTSHCKTENGYPRIRKNRKHYLISRYFWEQKNGPIPEGMCVLHKCDTPACINVEHFFLGTHQDNMRDRDKKSRQAKGENCSLTKLKKEQVLMIREESGTYREIAKKYGIGLTIVGYIKKRKRWGWL